jgi:sugar-phosphatase
MDGVIVDTRQSVTDFWQALATAHQIPLTPADFDQHIHGCPAIHTLDVLFPHLTSEQRHATIASLESYEAGLRYAELPGAAALLHSLKHYHIPTALVTGARRPKVAEVIRQLGLDGLFTVQVTAADIQRGKPDPECYLRAANDLQRQPASCIVFEDAINGVKAAVAAGMLCIGVQPLSMASLLLQSGAYTVVPDFAPVSVLPAEVNQTGGRSLSLITTGQRLWLLIEDSYP